MSERIPPGYPEILRDFAEQYAADLVERGHRADDAAERALDAAEFLRRHFAGQKVYVPSGRYYEASRRYGEIAAKFNGSNLPELCREYNLSETRIREIIDIVRSADTHGRQGNLI